MERPFKVLLIEDYAMIAQAMQRILVHQSCQVNLAKTVSEAKDFARQERFHLVLLDIGLPDGDGVELGQWLRHNNHSRNHKTPIIVNTAHFYDQEERKRCSEAGINAVFMKPMSSEEIQRIVHAVRQSQQVVFDHFLN